MTAPLVTVIVSSFERPNLIRDALDSIARQQDAPPTQVLVADDHSSQTTLSWIRDGLTQLFDRSPHVQHTALVQPDDVPTFDQRQRPGRCARCINTALPHTQGTYLAFLPDDDMLMPRSLADRVAFMEAHPEVKACFGRLIACMSFEPVFGVDHADCRHFDNAFFSPIPVASIANKADHGQVMVRAWHDMPRWPETPLLLVQRAGERRLCTLPPGEFRAGQDAWVASYDCPDAGWFARLAEAGVSAFYPVPVPVVLKRYHRYGHRTYPGKRE